MAGTSRLTKEGIGVFIRRRRVLRSLAWRVQFDLMTDTLFYIDWERGVLRDEFPDQLLTSVAGLVDHAMNVDFAISQLDGHRLPPRLSEACAEAHQAMAVLTTLWPSWEVHVKAHDPKGSARAPQPGGETGRTLHQDLPDPDIFRIWGDAEVARQAAEAAMGPLNRLRRVLIEVSGAELGRLRPDSRLS